uniref:Uncharacterized protein n=1 Tax=Nelumbo nucifera TaxID=4432 RepID=A0A822ZP35_NELNU|nr:TPA_asm: hypothetical protein HUJ06_016500 [Nelumbo nucifera]
MGTTAMGTSKFFIKIRECGSKSFLLVIASFFCGIFNTCFLSSCSGVSYPSNRAFESLEVEYHSFNLYFTKLSWSFHAVYMYYPSSEALF